TSYSLQSIRTLESDRRMRRIFWIVAQLCLILLSLSLAAFSPPILPDVVGSELESWYVEQIVWSLIFGAAVGVAGAIWMRRRIRYVPEETGVSFLERVGARGFGVLAFSLGITLLIFFMTARAASF